MMAAIARLASGSLLVCFLLAAPTSLAEQRMGPGASVDDYKKALMQNRGIRPTQPRPTTSPTRQGPARAQGSSGTAARSAAAPTTSARHAPDVYQPPEGMPTAPSAGAESDGLSVQIYFAYDSALLTGSAKDELDKLGEALGSPELSGDRWFIEGHTDSIGSARYNEDLSQKRAISVMSYLVQKHSIPAGVLIPVGKGESEPFDPSNPSSNINRRVRIKHAGG